MAKQRHIGIIGYGAIGRQLSACLLADPGYSVTVLVRRPGSEPGVARLSFTTSLEDLLASAPDLVVEAASAEAFLAVVPRCLDEGFDVVAASISALNVPETLRLVTDISTGSGTRLILPSGAVGGLDYLAAAALAGAVGVVYTSRKPPAAWKAELAAIGQDCEHGPVVLFEGSAPEAAALYPRNLNAALTVALVAGIERTRVRVIADPSVDENTHEIEITSAAGRARFAFANVASAENPKTSVITAFSLAASVRRYFEPIA